MDINDITEPGIYTIPTNRGAVKLSAAGRMKQRDVGKYRLLEHTDENGKVTNWQKELPDGEWRKVDPIRGL